MLDPGLPPRYTEVRLLGQGGMGEVYAAYDSELRRTVAVKVLRQRPGFDASFKARFRREMKVMASVAHPNVVRVFGVQEAAGQLCLVMEFVQGESLHAWAAPRRSDWRTIVGVFVDLADALATLHAEGLLHRDLKPDNVMMTPSGVPKLLDFGLALPLDRDDRTRLTETGYLVGTPAYLAPEVLQGDPASQRSDVYSFAVMLFECLTGKMPLELHEVLALLHGKAETDSVRVLSLPAAVPDGLRSLLTQGLVMRPERRLPSASELHRALVAVLRTDGAPEPVVHPTGAAPAVSGPAASVAVGGAPAARPPRSRLAALAVWGAALLTAGAFMVARRDPGPATEGLVGPAPSARSTPDASGDRARLVAGPFVYPSSDAADVDVVVDRPLAHLRVRRDGRELAASGPWAESAGQRYSARIPRGDGHEDGATFEADGFSVRVAPRFLPRSVAETPPSTRPPRRLVDLQAAVAALPPALAEGLLSSLTEFERRSVADRAGPWRPPITAGPAVAGSRLFFGDSAGRVSVAAWPLDAGFTAASRAASVQPQSSTTPCWTDAASNFGEVVDLVPRGSGFVAYACRARTKPTSYRLLTPLILLRDELELQQASLPPLPAAPQAGARYGDLLLVGTAGAAGPAALSVREVTVSPYPGHVDNPRQYHALPTSLACPPGLDAVMLLHRASRAQGPYATLAMASVGHESPPVVTSRTLTERLLFVRGGLVPFEGCVLFCCSARPEWLEEVEPEDAVAAPDALWACDAATGERAWAFAAHRTLRDGLFSVERASGFVAAGTATTLYLVNARRRTELARERSPAASGPLMESYREVAIAIDRVREALGPGTHPDLRFIGTPLLAPSRVNGQPRRLLVLVGTPRGSALLQRTFDMLGGDLNLDLSLVALELEPSGLRAHRCGGPYPLASSLVNLTCGATLDEETGLGLVTLASHLFIVDPGAAPGETVLLHHGHGSRIGSPVLRRNVACFRDHGAQVQAVALSPTRLPERAR